MITVFSLYIYIERGYYLGFYNLCLVTYLTDIAAINVQTVLVRIRSYLAYIQDFLLIQSL
jgi:hypothetical protein